jgi:Kef-type K+ transport system membrane component KefB
VNELSSIGMILLFALFAGHLVKFLRVPEVTGYIAAGIAVGPHGLGWISHSNLQSLQLFSQVALGLILFSIGAIFERSRMQQMGKKLALITGIESMLVALLISVAMLLAGQSLPVSLMLGAIAIETAAATTLMVMRECNSAGPLTDTMVGVIGMNNIVCLTCFSLIAAAIEIAGGEIAGGGWYGVYSAAYPLIWQFVGSTALGFLIGLLLATWSSRVIEKGETLILLIGCVLLCVGVSQLLQLSALIASLAVGATMVNFSDASRRLFSALGQTDPPLYAIFFVIAGADLNLGLVTTVGTLGFIYLLARSAGKLAGAWLGARLSAMSPEVQKTLGLGLLSQAGLAVGLTLTIGERFPDIAPTVNTIVLSAVVIFEILGPVATRFVLTRSGEVRPQPGLVEPTF